MFCSLICPSQGKHLFLQVQNIFIEKQIIHILYIYLQMFNFKLQHKLNKMTIVMRGSPAAGDSPQETSQQQQHGQQQQQPAPPQTQPPTTTQAPLVTTQSTGQPAQSVPAQQTGGGPSSQVPNGSQPDEGGQGDGVVQLAEDQEPDFPHVELAKLDEMINRPRWVVPVLPKGELEVLLEASVKLCKEGMDFLYNKLHFDFHIYSLYYSI